MLAFPEIISPKPLSQKLLKSIQKTVLFSQLPLKRSYNYSNSFTEHLAKPDIWLNTYMSHLI